MKKVNRRQFIKYTGGVVGSAMLAGLVAGCSSAGKTAENSSQPANQAAENKLLDKIVLFGPVAPLTIPLAVMKAQDRLKQVAQETNFTVWTNPDQLRAQVTGGQVHFAAFPTNVAANFYNKGVGLKLLNVAIWGILYLVSSQPNITSLADLKGEELAVPFKGDMPDLVFRYLCNEQGINPAKDFNLRYLSTPVEAAQLLAAGQVKHAVLSEPAATMAVMTAKNNGKELYRVLDLQKVWGQVTGREAVIPQAGIAALPSIINNHPEIVPQFQREYSEALNWVKANPQDAGQIGETYIQGLKAGLVANSLQFTRMKFVSAKDAKADLEFFYQALAGLSPDIIGGKLPDEGFYYQGA
jgi:NitT/TauT family transport system substrate-binding protein